jgi:hypothetical protein
MNEKDLLLAIICVMLLHCSRREFDYLHIVARIVFLAGMVMVFHFF